MTRCPQCGQPVHPATAVCPRCGQRLAAQAPYADADPNAPPWIQQLQADQQQQPYAPTIGNTARVPAPQPGMNPPQPAGYQQGWPSADPNGAPAWGNGNGGWGQQPGPGSPGYQPGAQAGQQGGGRLSAGSFFDESALPEWLRQSPDTPQAPAPSPNGMGQAVPPSAGGASAFPSIEQAGQYQAGLPAAGGMPAHALLDSSALPQWLGGQAHVPAQQGYGTPGSDGLPAQSLVDEQALPQWLRAQPNDAPARMPSSAAPQWSANPSANEVPPNWAGQPFANAQAAPGPAPAQAAPWQAGPASQQPSNAPYSQDGQAGRMSANQFIDESALPEWLKAQGGQTSGPAAGGNGVGQPWAPQQQAPAQPSVPPRGDAPQGRFSASDLVDPNAMPQWARGGEAAPTFDSANGWGGPQRPSYPGEANGNGNGGRSQAMPAARRQDPLASTELPSWLQEPQRQQYAPRQHQGYGANGGYAGNGWDEQQGQEYEQGYDQQYDWDQPDQYGSYGGQQDPYQDPYGGSAGWDDDPYRRDDYPAYPNRAGYGRGQPGPRQAPQPAPRAAGRRDERPRGWRAFFRRK